MQWIKAFGTYLCPYTIAIIFVGEDPDRVTPTNDIMTIQLNHCPLVTHVCIRYWVTIGSDRVCHLFGDKPLPKPTLIFFIIGRGFVSSTTFCDNFTALIISLISCKGNSTNFWMFLFSKMLLRLSLKLPTPSCFRERWFNKEGTM